ncbi:hypothetical protein B0A48_06878 [Cryoendolithus antarcticus]|uniref:Secreted protein n=1 Tax=Cryoendolithus antarcticus TaxID=1507870 RepID=A0A1V8T9Y1_9PEZI|nr:hypothetical protein B0A48_06878 [Cryoendolithus antarcticus]
MTPPMFMLPAVVGLSVTCVAGRAVLGSFAVSASVCDIEPGPVDGVAIAFVAVDDAGGMLVEVDSPPLTDSELGTRDGIAGGTVGPANADVDTGMETAVGLLRPVAASNEPCKAVTVCAAVVVGTSPGVARPLKFDAGLKAISTEIRSPERSQQTFNVQPARSGPNVCASHNAGDIISTGVCRAFPSSIDQSQSGFASVACWHGGV